MPPDSVTRFPYQAAREGYSRASSPTALTEDQLIGILKWVLIYIGISSLAFLGNWIYGYLRDTRNS
jgi:hypothetical protein